MTKTLQQLTQERHDAHMHLQNVTRNGTPSQFADAQRRYEAAVSAEREMARKQRG